MHMVLRFRDNQAVNFIEETHSERYVTAFPRDVESERLASGFIIEQQRQNYRAPASGVSSVILCVLELL